MAKLCLRRISDTICFCAKHASNVFCRTHMKVALNHTAYLNQHNFTASATGSYIKKECTYLYTLTQSHHSTSSHTTMPCQLFNRPLQFLRGLTFKSLPDSALPIDWQPKKPETV